MKKITLLLAMMLSVFWGYAQADIASSGVEQDLVSYGNGTSQSTFAPCGYAQPTAGFPNAGNISDGSAFSAAEDFNVAVFMNFTPETLVLPLLTSAGSSITGVEVTFYADAAGLPGAVEAMVALTAPASQVMTGTAFGRDIVEVTMDFTGSGISLPGGGLPGGTNYWMGIRATNSVANNDLFWELTSTITGSESSFTIDDGATWQATGAIIAGGPWDFVFNFSGDCALPDPVAECGNAPELIPAGAALPTPSSGAMNPSIATVTDTGLIGTDYTFDSVAINVEHTWAADIEMTLTSPAGTVMNVMFDRGGSTGLDVAADLLFTDDSANAVTGWSGGAPEADYQPEGGLFNTVFDGEDVNGTWTININDDAGGDIGQLNSYCINFTPILGSPPMITCPMDVTTTASMNTCGAVVGFTPPLVVDPDGDLVSVDQTTGLPSGSEFPVGVTTNTFVATDSTGNTAMCSFTVTVTDDQAPDITCMDITVELDAAGMATVVPGDVATGTDNCPAPITYTFGTGVMAGSLTTTFASNNGFSGNMFEVNPLTDVTVTSFDVNNSTVGDVDYEVYMKMGSYVGFESDAAAWTLVGSTTVPSAGIDNPTPLNLGMSVALTAGNMVSFYVANTNSTVHRYVNGTTEGALWASDANLEIFEGVGKGGPATFNAQTFRPRNFSGNIVYESGMAPTATLDFDCASVGANTVQVNATDGAGNTSSCMAVVTVEDNIAPDIVCIGEPSTVTDTVTDAPALAITDNDPAGVSTIISVTADETIVDLDLDLDIAHSWVGDLIVTLTSPAGTPVVLVDRMGYTGTGFGCSEDNLQITLDDDATDPIEDECSGTPITGTYSPNNPLSAFNGESSLGDWTLTVSDNAGGDTGSIENWGFTYSYDTTGAPFEVDLDANGMATVTVADLLMSVNEACGWTATAGGGAPVPVSLTTTFAGGNGNFGTMFDVNAITDLQVDSFDVNMDDGANLDVEVYAKTGTHVGFELDAAAWTLIGSAPGTASSGDGMATPLNLMLGYAMAAGSTSAFFVTATNIATGSGFNYTNGTTVGAVFASDANMEVLEGSATTEIFGGTIFAPRNFNGNVVYSQGATASTTIDFDCSNLGANLVEITVTDASGNESMCTATVNVNDVTNPVLICQDATIELGPDGTAEVDPMALLATMPDTVGEAVVIGSDNQSNAEGFTSFVVDITDAATIEFDWDYTTNDAAGFDGFGYSLNGTYTELTDETLGNQSGSASVAVVPGDVFGYVSQTDDNTFGNNETVITNFMPGYTGQFDPANWTLTLDNSDGDAFFVIIPGGPLSFDACGITILAVDVTEVTCADIGTPITITVFASDASGNLASCTSVVTVVDLLAPEVVCPADQTVDPGPGNLFYEIPDYYATGDATATDNCTDPLTILSQDPAAGTLVPDGTYTITMSATDEYGNVGTCTFELEVISVLGVSDNVLDSAITMFPNPANTSVTLANTSNVLLDQAAIYDTNGRLVSTIDLSDMQQEKVIDVSTLATGVYMVQVISENASTVKRLVKE